VRWKRPDHTWWLGGCLAGLLTAIVAGGFSLPLFVVFVGIFGAGAMLIGLDGEAGAAISAESEPEPSESEPYPEDSVSDREASDRELSDQEASDQEVSDQEATDESAEGEAPGEDAAPGVRPSGDASPT